MFHQYTIQLQLDDVENRRNELQKYLAEKGIPSMIYYPLPAHKQGMFASFNLGELNLPVTDDLTRRVISFPIHTEMEQAQIDYICEHILNYVNQ